jgi:ribonuclease J
VSPLLSGIECGVAECGSTVQLHEEFRPADRGPSQDDDHSGRGTVCGRQPVCEYELEAKITNLIKTAPGITLASFSPQHVDRPVAIFRATQKSGKTFVADAYTAFVMHLIASETSIPRPESDNTVRVFFPKYFEQTYQRKRLAHFYRQMAPARITIEDIRKNPERYVMVFRPSMLDSDFSGQLPDQARCLYSRWTGYLEQPEWKRTKAELDRVNGDLIEVHTSGHIHADDIVDFVGQVGPKIVIPIHTFDGDDFAHHFQNAHLLPDGDVFTV